MLRGCALFPLPLGTYHVHDLTPARHQIRQKPCRLIRQRPGFGPCRCGKVSDYRSIDRIGLGALSECLGKGTDLRRIDNDDRKAGAANCRCRNGLEAARRLERHNSGCKLLQPSGQLLQPRTVAFYDERLTTGMNCNVKTVLRYVDTNRDDTMVTLPCLIGLRTLRPRRLFGFNGLTDGA